MTFNIQVTNGDGSSHAVECIADTKPNGPYTWMPLHFQANEQELSMPQRLEPESCSLQLVGSKGDYQLCSTQEFHSVQVLDLHGRSLLFMDGHHKTVRLPFLLPGLYIVRASFMSGKTMSRKLSIRA